MALMVSQGIKVATLILNVGGVIDTFDTVAAFDKALPAAVPTATMSPTFRDREMVGPMPLQRRYWQK
jgi:hypothetical protein